MNHNTVDHNTVDHNNVDNNTMDHNTMDHSVVSKETKTSMPTSLAITSAQVSDRFTVVDSLTLRARNKCNLIILILLNVKCKCLDLGA